MRAPRSGTRTATRSSCANGIGEADSRVVRDVGGPAFGKRNEFRLARNGRKAARLPILGRLVDAFLAARDEIPPQEALAERRAAQQQHASAAAASDLRLGAGLEYEHLPRAEFAMVELDRAFRDIR